MWPGQQVLHLNVPHILAGAIRQDDPETASATAAGLQQNGSWDESSHQRLLEEAARKGGGGSQVHSSHARRGSAAGLEPCQERRGIHVCEAEKPQVSIASGSALAGDLKEVVEFLK